MSQCHCPANEREKPMWFPDPQLQLLTKSAGFALILRDSTLLLKIQTVNHELRSSEMVPPLVLLSGQKKRKVKVSTPAGKCDSLSLKENEHLDHVLDQKQLFHQ